MTWVTIIFCNFCSGILCIILASKKRRAPLPWFLLALPAGVLALFVLLALPARSNRDAKENPQPSS